MAGCCEHGNEYSVFIKCEVFSLLQEILDFQKEICCLELIRWLVAWRVGVDVGARVCGRF